MKTMKLPNVCLTIVLLAGFASSCRSEVRLSPNHAIYWGDAGGPAPVFYTMKSRGGSYAPDEVCIQGERDRSGKDIVFRKIHPPTWQSDDPAFLYFAEDWRFRPENRFQFVVFEDGLSPQPTLWLEDRANGASSKRSFRRAEATGSCVAPPRTGGTRGPENRSTNFSDSESTDGSAGVTNGKWNFLDDFLVHVRKKCGAGSLAVAAILFVGWLLANWFGAPKTLQVLWLFFLAVFVAKLSAVAVDFVCEEWDWRGPIALALRLAHLVVPFVVFFRFFVWSVSNRNVFFEQIVYANPQPQAPNVPPGWRDWDPFGARR